MNQDDMIRRLEKPCGKVDVVMDTDMYNEVDDIYALAYLLKSDDRLNLKAVFAAPFYSPPVLGRVRQTDSPAQGMEESYQAILELLRVMNLENLNPIVFHGSRSNLSDETKPVDSEAARELIRLSRGYSADHPLYVIAIAVITDIASALLMDPTLKERIVVIWVGGHAWESNSCSDFNMIQDIAAARVVFGCGVPLVQLPCNGVVSEFRVCKPELEYWLKGRNTLCDYLLRVTLEFVALQNPVGTWSKPLWDVTAVAWLLDKRFMQERLEHSPIPEYDRKYAFDHTRHFIKYVFQINRDILLEDLFRKLTKGNENTTRETRD